MRSRGRRQPPPYFTGKDRSRLVRLGFGLVLVILAMKVAADPATWNWFFPGERDGTTRARTLDDVAYAVKLDDGDLAADEFRSPPEIQASGGRQPPGPDGRIAPATLSTVEDDTLNLRAAERDAYFATLSRLRELDAKSIEAAAEQGVTFPAVMIEPSHYRGQAITIEGRARRIVEIELDANLSRFDTLYDLWVFTSDSGTNPWHVVATELPDGLPRGEVIEDGVPVKVTGIFFKRQGYASQGGLHVAPLLLAKTVRRVPPPPSATIADWNPVPWVLSGLAVLGGGFALLLWRFRREDRTFARTTLTRFNAATGETIDAIPPATEIDPNEFFRQLEARETASEPRPSGSGYATNHESREAHEMMRSTEHAETSRMRSPTSE